MRITIEFDKKIKCFAAKQSCYDEIFGRMTNVYMGRIPFLFLSLALVKK